MIKIMKIIIRGGGGGKGGGRRTSRLWGQNFIINTSVCTEEVVRFLKRDIIKRSCNVTLSPLYCHEASPTSFEMIELIIKFCHHNRDVRPPSPSPPPPLLIMIFMIFIILLMQTIIKIRHHNRDFDCPDCGGKNPDWAGIPGSDGGDGFLLGLWRLKGCYAKKG